MTTAKLGVQLIAETCLKQGIRRVVFSPGSRSAPLVIALSALPEIECLVIADERSAAYFALGMAQQTEETVAVVCTSGTAAINLLPACCEAYYQKIPLLFLTADRPIGAVAEGANQAINQIGIFQNFAKDYEVDADNDDASSIVSRVEQAIAETQKLRQPARLNIHLAEPLYEHQPSITPTPFQPEKENTECSIKAASKSLFDEAIYTSTKTLVVVGLRNPQAEFLEKIKELCRRKDTIVWVESTSNCSVEGTMPNFDSYIAAVQHRDIHPFIPDVVLTFGQQIISKRLREFLRNHPPKYHFYGLTKGQTQGHNYFHLPENHFFESPEDILLSGLLERSDDPHSDYFSSWKQVSEEVENLQRDFLQQAPYSDFSVFEKIISHLPANVRVQYGNSTPVRYSNFFRHHSSIRVNANRGASGIDGCVSTAVGAAHIAQQMTVCIVGDVSFLYDSNALWNNYLSPNLRIIVINNSGGNIFRLIDGPTTISNFEKFFETKHALYFDKLASMYGLLYYFCDRPDELDPALESFFHLQKPQAAILEIKTDNETSAAVFKNYFNQLKETL